MLVDKCYLTIKAGNGGNGIISWKKEAFLPLGGPYGGNGGKGGDVYIVGDHNLNSLVHLRDKKEIKAFDGENGKTKVAHGKNGADVYIKVPVGTVVLNAQTKKVIVDILADQQTFLLCLGGLGGKGNFWFKSAKNRAPLLCENGDLGESLAIILELRFIADVGLLGLPNAGKSTLLNTLAKLNLKTAPYPFTTLTPALGVVSYNQDRLLFADIPGIIAQAAQGAGLGLDFLKHIQRCYFLIHLISIAPDDTKDPYTNYLTVMEELKQYKKALLRKKIYVVLNKIDQPNSQQNIDAFLQQFQKNNKQKVYCISGIHGTNVAFLLKDIFMRFQKNKTVWNQRKYQKMRSYSVIKVNKKLKPKIIYQQKNGIWHVISEHIRYWQNKIPFITNENIVRFMNKINMEQIEAYLKKKGLKSGDVFKVNDIDFEIS